MFSFSERLHEYVVGIYLKSSFREFQNHFFLKLRPWTLNAQKIQSSRTEINLQKETRRKTVYHEVGLGVQSLEWGSLHHVGIWRHPTRGHQVWNHPLPHHNCATGTAAGSSGDPHFTIYTSTPLYHGRSPRMPQHGASGQGGTFPPDQRANTPPGNALLAQNPLA